MSRRALLNLAAFGQLVGFDLWTTRKCITRTIFRIARSRFVHFLLSCSRAVANWIAAVAEASSTSPLAEHRAGVPGSIASGGQCSEMVSLIIRRVAASSRRPWPWAGTDPRDQFYATLLEIDCSCTGEVAAKAKPAHPSHHKLVTAKTSPLGRSDHLGPGWKSGGFSDVRPSPDLRLSRFQFFCAA
jgi:hypothetical protein